MIRFFVFDTNTLISAHLLKSSISRKAYDFAFDKGLIVHSSETLTEFAQVFIRRKFDKYISLDKRIVAIAEQEHRTLLISVKESVEHCRDPQDDKFLSLAIAAKANCIAFA